MIFFGNMFFQILFIVLNFNLFAKKEKVTECIEKVNIYNLKKSFQNGTWYLDYVKGTPSKIVIQYCQKAYKAYLAETIMKYLHINNEITQKALEDQIKVTDRKCLLCLASLKVSSDHKFYQEHGNKFILKESNNV